MNRGQVAFMRGQRTVKRYRVVMNETCSPIRENGLGIGGEYAAGHIEHLTGGD